MGKYTMKIRLCLLILLVGVAASAQNCIIWSNNLSNASNEWFIIDDTGGNSSITSSNGLGLLYVDAANSRAAFGVKTDGSVPFIPFRPDLKDKYELHLLVDSITWSTSYDLALDEFDSDRNWIRTIWQVFPLSGTSTHTGLAAVPLGGFTFSAHTTFLMPKFTVYTGDGAQTVRLDEIYVLQDVSPIGLVIVLR